MTRKINFRNIAIATAFTAASGVAILALSSPASAKSVLNCKAGDRQSVVDCCENLVEKKGRPIWMRQGGKNCMGLVQCVSRRVGNGPSTSAAAAASSNGRVKTVCSIVRYEHDNGKTPNDGRDKNRETRTPNDRPSRGSSSIN